MNITTKIIVTDTNIITDLSNAKILNKFVMLDNVYISDMIKNDEIKNSTGDIEIINKFKTIGTTDKQILEIIKISNEKNGLSQYDIINFIIARDNNGILATGDKKLKEYSEDNGIEVIRTLKIIDKMHESKIISKDEVIKACELLKNDKTTRIPKDELDKRINKLKKDLTTC